MIKFKTALFGAFDTLLQSHVLLEVVVHHRVDEVASISLSALVDLLQGAEVVHPKQLGTFVSMIIAAHDAVDLVRAFAQGLSELRSHILRRRFNRKLDACAEFLQLEVAHHIVGELVALALFARSAQDLVPRHLDDFVFIVLQTEDRAIDRLVCDDKRPVLACDSKNSVHVVINQ